MYDVAIIGGGIVGLATARAIGQCYQDVKGNNSLHICNAPSPAATSSLEIGKAIGDRVSLP